jgi:acyl carrier protein
MTNEEIISEIKKFLVEEFEVDEAVLGPDAVLKEALDLDSLDYVDLVVVIESTFGFKVKGEDFVGMITFKDFCDYIITKVNEKK